MKLTQKRLARPSLGGMLATRQGALVLALVCAVAAAGILVFAMGRYRSSVKTGTKQDTVLVATGEIQKGTSGDAIAAQRLFKSTPILATQVVPGALTDAGFVQGKVAASDILPGQQLTAAEFTAPAGVLGELTRDQGAVSVSIDEQHGNTDILQAGDRVDVYGDFVVPGSPTPELTLIVPGALVLKPAAGPAGATPAAGAPPASTLPGSSLVLAVSTNVSAEVAYAADNGKIWLVLRPANAIKATPGLTTLASVLSNSPPSPPPTTGKIP